MIFGHYDPNTLIIGASVAGLAAAASLQKLAIEYTIIEKHGQTATPWRNHYNRLHLHTNKHLSNLPYKKFILALTISATKQFILKMAAKKISIQLLQL